MTDIVRLKASQIRNVRDELLSKQNYRCAICNKDMLNSPSSDACVDHDHTTGFVRGVVCRNCNRGEGKVRTVATMCKRQGTQLGWLVALLKYLSLHSIPQTNYLHPTHKTADEKRLERNAKAKARRQSKKVKT